MKKETKENPMKDYDKTNRNFLSTDEEAEKKEKKSFSPKNIR
jgi:hypothetical protein